MKLTAAALTLLLASGTFAANDTQLERRVEKLEQTIARLEAKLSALEAKLAERGSMGGMMGRGGMMGGGMMGGGKPNEQWRAPETK